MIILYPILIFLSKTVNGKFSLLQMFPPPKFSSPSLVLHNLRFLTPKFFLSRILLSSNLLLSQNLPLLLIFKKFFFPKSSPL